MIDLHRSRGLFTPHHRWIGQVILMANARGERKQATDTAEYVTDYMNENHVPQTMRFHRFTMVDIRDIDRGSGLLIQKVQRELDSPGFLVESTDFLLDLETQIRWTTAVTEQLLEQNGIQRTA